MPSPRRLPVQLRVGLLIVGAVPVFGLAIPVIVRHGETSAKVVIDGLAYDRKTATLACSLQRSGNQSVYGDLKATFKPASGSVEELFRADGLAVYTPNPVRRLSYSAPMKAAGPGRLHLTYALPEAEGGTLLAEAYLDLP